MELITSNFERQYPTAKLIAPFEGAKALTDTLKALFVYNKGKATLARAQLGKAKA